MGTPDRIPYGSWINSQLSIARHYGGCTFNGVEYVVEYETNDLVRADGMTLKKRLANELKNRGMHEAAKQAGLFEEKEPTS